MADYYEQTVVQQSIPVADMTPIERLVLSRVFEAVEEPSAVYFFAELNPAMSIYAGRSEVEAALAASQDAKGVAFNCVTEQLEAADPDSTDIDIDLSGTSWEYIFQDIVKRSKTLRYISVVAAFTCSKMRLDGFGGMAILITAHAVIGKSTNDLLEEFLDAAGLDERAVAEWAGLHHARNFAAESEDAKAEWRRGYVESGSVGRAQNGAAAGTEDASCRK
jgi:hypothetical protein